MPAVYSKWGYTLASDSWQLLGTLNYPSMVSSNANITTDSGSQLEQ